MAPIMIGMRIRKQGKVSLFQDTKKLKKTSLKESLRDYHRMDQDFLRIEKVVKGILCDFPEIKLIYLFGSRAQKKAGSRSDYDFAVLTDPKQSGEDLRARITHAFSVKLNYGGIDVVLLNNSPIDLAYAVISNGKRFYEKSVEIRVDYEAYVLGRYFDFLPVLRAQRDEVIRGENHASRIQRYRETFGRTERTLSQIGTS